jgi:uncharacterized protein YqjF (DUF2071 family)
MSYLETRRRQYGQARQAPSTLLSTSVAAHRHWVWSQHWLDVLFMHWQVPLASLRSQVPTTLEIDTLDGHAWVSLVLFRLRVRPRWLPFLPGFSTLVEMNFRTYVRCGQQPGIWFLSVHADNPWAIYVAKRLTPMPYRRARMRYWRSARDFHFRAGGSAPGLACSLSFQPGCHVGRCGKSTLDEWLLERYRLFVRDRRGRLMEAGVTHPSWVVCDVDVSVSANSIGESLGLDLCRAPERAHYSAGLRARFGAFRPWPHTAIATRSHLA